MLFSPFTSLVYFAWSPANLDPNIALGIFRVNFTEYILLALVHTLGWSILLGHAIQRRFNNPSTPLLRRRFSYPLTLVLTAIALSLTGTNVKDYDVWIHVILLTSLGLLYCLALTVALTPDRQTLKDRARFRHTQAHGQCLPLWQDFLVGDTSSPVVAIALNLLLAVSLFASGFLSFYGDLLKTSTDVLLFSSYILLFVGLILFSVLVSQTLLLLPRKKNWLWFGIVGSISCFMLPGLTLGMGIVWLARYPAPAQILGMSPELAVFTLPLGLLWTTITLLAVAHTRQMIRSGCSESQTLLSGR